MRNSTFLLAVAGRAASESVSNVRSQCLVVDVSQRLVTDVGIQLFQIEGCQAYRRLVLVLDQVTRGGFPPGSDCPYTVDLLLAQLLQLMYQVLLCLLPIACSSAFLNSLTSEDLVDVPDLVPLVEAANGFSRHGLSPWRSLRG